MAEKALDRASGIPLLEELGKMKGIWGGVGSVVLG